MGLFNKKSKDAPSSSSTKKYLKIDMTQNGAEYTFTLDGRLDTMTSPKLNSKINEIINNADKLVMDLKELEFISSAGLRVLLGALQAIEDKGEMVIINLSPAVREVFDLTGFSRLFNIK